MGRGSDRVVAVQVHINGRPYRVEGNTISGAQLRALAVPPIGPESDLFVERPGLAQDELIQDGQTVTLEEGMHFFSAPRTITAGATFGSGPHPRRQHCGQRLD